MKLTERSYRTKQVRPKPQVIEIEAGETILVATLWGNEVSLTRSIEITQDYIGATSENAEVTTPFEFLSCYSSKTNQLRVAALLANDQLYRQENRGEYNSGLELVTIAKRNGEVAWVKVGMPHILLLRQGMAPMPIACSGDSSSEISGEAILPPLPSNMLGLENSLNIEGGSFRQKEGDRLLLLACSIIPSVIWSQVNATSDLMSIGQLLAKAQPDQPYWLGLVDL